MKPELQLPSEGVNRRDLMLGGVLATVAAVAPGVAGATPTRDSGGVAAHGASGGHAVDRITTKDGVDIYYKDWGPKNGPVVTLSHGWPLSSDSWDYQAFFLASNGFRVIAHDRRGHGRSSQPWDGNDMDHYADDMAAVIDALNLKNVTAIGFSTGGGEVTRYVGRHGSSRVAKVALVSAVPPLMAKTPGNPGGVPVEVFDGMRAAMLADRSQFFRDVASGPFYGFNRPGAKPSQGMIDSWWSQGMMGGFKNTFDSVKAFSETDFTADLAKFTMPTLIVHGDDDQVVPIDVGGRATKKLVPHAILKVYKGAPHGLAETHKDQLNQDILAFLRS
ncbi:alpha/beta hydrolase [Pandoraea pnomenusa]|uniref:alpha/beta fold hydrolase n=1 Tax=Pandoraea pnomenusa TaxID=93220 RepID=UPI0033401517